MQVYEVGAAVGLVGEEVVLGAALGHVEDGGDDGREEDGADEGGTSDGMVVKTVEGSGEVLGTLDGTVVGRFDDGKVDGMVELGEALREMEGMVELGDALREVEGTMEGRFDDGKLVGMVELGEAEGLADGGSVGQVV